MPKDNIVIINQRRLTDCHNSPTPMRPKAMGAIGRSAAAATEEAAIKAAPPATTGKFTKIASRNSLFMIDTPPFTSRTIILAL